LIVLLLNIVVIHKIRQVGKLKIGKANSNRNGVRCPLTSSPTNLLTADEDNERRNRTNGGINAQNKGPTVTLLWVSFYLIITVLPNTIVYAMQPLVHYGSLPCSFDDMSKDVSLCLSQC
jgi:hypothetical protein